MKRLALLLAVFLLLIPAPLQAADEGLASWYGPGNGVAMHFCTWTLRHTQGCGEVKITSLDTGRSVIAPVIDYCYCRVGTSLRIVDLEWGVVEALGLSIEQGLYRVRVERLSAALLPNTATR